MTDPGTEVVRIDTGDRVLTRRRIEQLRTVGLFQEATLPRSFQYLGPPAPMDRFLDENAPVHPGMLDSDGWWSDSDAGNLWGALVFVEPDWRITRRSRCARVPCPDGHDYWVVWEDWGHPWDASDLHNQHWASEELARRYLQLLTDNFWAKVHR